MNDTKSWISRGNARTGFQANILLVLLAALALPGTANAAPRVAVVGFSPPWCQLLIDNGYECDILPNEGPASLKGYDVVVVLSKNWTDPDGLLPAFLRSGRGVITVGGVPEALGIDTDPVVQAWIGANMSSGCLMNLRTIVTDPMLGTIQPRERLIGCGIGPAIYDTTGHPNAKILATWYDWLPTANIGIMRNTWEGGQSAYLGLITPGSGSPLHEEIVLSTVRVLSNPIPTVSEWGLVILTLLVLTAGTAVLINRRTAPALSW